MKSKPIKKIILSILFFFPPSALYVPRSYGLPAEDVQVVADARYVEVAQKLIREAKTSIQVMMFEMGYYDQHSNTPSNLLIKGLIEAKKRGV